MWNVSELYSEISVFEIYHNQSLPDMTYNNSGSKNESLPTFPMNRSPKMVPNHKLSVIFYTNMLGEKKTKKQLTCLA